MPNTYQRGEAAREVRHNLRFHKEPSKNDILQLCDDYDFLERENTKQAQRIDDLESRLLHLEA